MANLISDPLTKEKLDAIPLAKGNPSAEEMRKICLDFMRLTLTFPWTPSEDYENFAHAVCPLELKKGVVYHGIPVVEGGYGNLYRIMEYYDTETGVVDVSELGKEVLKFAADSACVAATAWSRVVSSAKACCLDQMTRKNGYLPVGPYTYDEKLDAFHKYFPRDIIKDNGLDVMYQSYAALQPADGIRFPDHVGMICAAPTVIYKEDGTINGEESFVLYCAQRYHTDEKVDIKSTFADLCKNEALPFTFAELQGEVPFHKAEVLTNGIIKTCFNTEELKQITLTSTYPVSDVFITVSTNDFGNGKVLYRDTYRLNNFTTYDIPLANVLKMDEIAPFAESCNNTLDVSFQLYSGHLKKGYLCFTGTLCVGKRATELEEIDFVEKFKAIPLAKKSMTPDQLRQICVDYMRLQLSFTHKLKDDHDYWIDRHDHHVFLKKEHVHAGLPYVNVGCGSLYRVMEVYDPETGVVDFKKLGNDKRLFGNACSGAAATAWARAISSAKLGYTMNMTQYNGFPTVGPYKYPEDLESFSNPQKYNAKSVCLENGEQVMFESYAQIQPADGLLNPGHIRMASGTSHVVRREDGTIDGDKSWAVACDQVTYSTAWHHTHRQKNGDYYNVQGGVDVKYSFSSLFRSGYIPFTFKEFLGQAELNPAHIATNIRKTVFSTDEIMDVVLKANYPISDVFYTAKDKDGNILLSGVHRELQFMTYELALKKVLPMEKIRKLEEQGGAHLELEAQLYNGKRLKGAYVFAGTLRAGKTATEVLDKSLAEKLSSIPIAKPGMSVDQIRKICLDYMRLQLSFPHKISDDIHYVVRSQRRARPLLHEIVHGGLPYVTVGSGSLYRVMEYYDPETGVVDTSGDMKNARVYGNACSGAACSAWSRAITSINGGYTALMTRKNGFIPVGPYTYPEEVRVFAKNAEEPEKSYTCQTVCENNGQQVMFESYACVLPGDGWVNPGHVRMNSALPTVVRKEDGSIDGEKSFVTYCDQVCYTSHPNHVRIQEDGNHYVAQGGVDFVESFQSMFDTHYIPVTFAEFLGEKEVEKAYVKLDVENKWVSADDLKEAKLVSNYPISDTFVTISDAEGKEIFRTVYRDLEFFHKEKEFGTMFQTEEWKALEEGDNTIKIQCQLYNGEKLVAFEGKLKK